MIEQANKFKSLIVQIDKDKSNGMFQRMYVHENSNHLYRKKILIAGLQKSGKTSIIYSLEGNYNLMSFHSLKPTPGLKINHLSDEDTEFNVWELGGQESYRRQYMDNFDAYSQETNKLIFVIDIQDPDNYNVAIDYLNGIIEHLNLNKIYPELSIFLHKFDPNIRTQEQYSPENIDKLLITPIKEIIPLKFNYEIFKTTIYTVFKKESI